MRESTVPNIPRYTVHESGNRTPLLSTCQRSDAYAEAAYQTSLTGRAVFVTVTA